MLQKDLFLITGIPGTGKTTYGNTFAQDFGFVHFDFENTETLSHFASDPNRFIRDVLQRPESIVITWGFLPDQAHIAAVNLLKSSGFKLFWFDGNRPAALSAFQKRGTVSKELFNLQMDRIEKSKVIAILKPALIKPFDKKEQFKPPRKLLKEMKQA
jgi:hypothetical protein